MGLKDLLSRWTKAKDAGALAKAERQSTMTAEERAADGQDYEARKDDVAIDASWAGSEARSAASDDLDAP
jgi:hypothetical protein